MTISLPPSDRPQPDDVPVASELAEAQLPLTGLPRRSPIPESVVTQLARRDARLNSAIGYLRAHEAQALAPRHRSLSELRRTTQRIALGLLAGGIPPAPKPDIPLPRMTIVVTEGDGTATAATIDSVAGQHYPALELILVGSPEMLFSYEPLAAELIDHSGADRAAAEAIGLARATGDLFAVLAPGDLMLPGALDRVGRHWARRRHGGLIRSSGAITGHGWRAAAALPLDRPAGLFVHRLAYDAAGGLDPTLGETAWSALLQAIQNRFGGSTMPGQTVLAATADIAPEPPRRSDRLDFSIGPGDILPEIGTAPRPLIPASCPVTGRLPHILLFSSPDTRSGDRAMSDFWYHPESHCVALSPPAEPLPIPPSLPAGDVPSPFRGWAGSDPILRWAGGIVPTIFARLLRAGWDDPTARELMRTIRRVPPAGSARQALDIGCGGGTVLDALKAQGWQTSGTETDEAAIEQARAKGHQVWACVADDVLRAVPVAARFDLIFVGHQLELQADPLATLQRLARLLEPNGMLVVATPNLDSAQLDRFGPTWAHWAPPLHRHIFSRQTLVQLADASGLALTRCRSFSHPYGSWMSLRLNATGLMGTVAQETPADETLAAQAECLAAASRLFYDWRGRGDYLHAVLQPNLKA